MKRYEMEIDTEATESLKIESDTKLTKEQLDRILGREPGRPDMLKLAVPFYDHEASRYPERIRVSFEDGHTAVYELRTEQPAPQIIESIRIIRKWKTGYQAPKRREKR